MSAEHSRGLAGRLAAGFLDSKLTPLVIATSLGLGALALLATPREEEPQIRVPMVDVMVAWPGAEPAEVESRIVTPVERMLWGVSGVEHVYSTARSGFALITVRFKVGESNEESLVKVFERQSALGHILPPGALRPIVELHSIDDVPFLTLTLWSERGSSDAAAPARRRAVRGAVGGARHHQGLPDRRPAAHVACGARPGSHERRRHHLAAALPGAAVCGRAPERREQRARQRGGSGGGRAPAARRARRGACRGGAAGGPAGERGRRGAGARRRGRDH